MRYGRSSVVFAVAPLVALSLIASTASAQSPPKSGRRHAPRALAKDAKERASGVILKVERVENGATRGKDTDAGRARGASRRLTINTAAVWRDWTRDQARTTDTGPASKDAKEGKNSVATRGEPADRNTLVVIDVVADTAVETRFRAADDESDAGSKTPPSAATDKDKEKSGKRTAAKPVRFKAEDLKPGLFVQVDYRHVSPRNPASKVVVIRPITTPSAADGAAGNDTKAGK